MIDFIKKVINKLLTKETITYIIFGVLTTLISVIVYTFCANSGMKTAPSNTVSTIIAVSFAFITNKIWVFESRDFSISKTLPEFVKFCTGRLFTYVLETSLLVFLIDFLKFDQIICKYFTQIIIIVLNYVISKWAVFKTK